MWMIFALICTVALLVRIYLKNVYIYWQNRGVPTPRFKYIWGNMKEAMTLKKATGEVYAHLYKRHEGYNYVPFYKAMKPAILIRSPDLIRDVLVKDFSSFMHNDFQMEEKVDLIFGKSPFVLKGAKWREVRNQISFSFSAVKMKALVPFIQETCDKLVHYIDKSESVTNGMGINSKELCQMYTGDNVASVCFGIDGHMFQDRNTEFWEFCKRVGRSSIRNSIINILFMLPTLWTLLKLSFFTKRMTAFLRNIMEETIAHRNKNNFVRNDYLELMMNLKKKCNDDKIFNNDDILAHVAGFLIDGFETSSAAISHMIYELAAHPLEQEKLRNEIEGVLINYNGEISYESIQEMTYLDCIVKECLRIHPPLTISQKVCTQTYTLPTLYENDTGPRITLEPGSTIIIPLRGLHMDEKYFPNSDHFNPDRFSRENKDKIVKFSYIPFGDGPRICLGMRYALLQTKMMLVTLVRYFKMEVNKRTQEPLVVDPKTLLNNPIGGIWIDFQKIK